MKTSFFFVIHGGAHSASIVPICSNLGRQAVTLIAPAMPFIVHLTASMLAYTGGLATAQRFGAFVKISCATPIMGPTMGALGVGWASVLSGEVSRQCSRARRLGYQRAFASPQSVVHSFDPENMLMDAILGIAAFRILGGVFRSVMPSDVLYVGAVAKHSIPAKGTTYASETERRKITNFYRLYGCHHCGTRRGKVIGDHMPPNKEIANMMSSRRAKILRFPIFRIPYASKIARSIGIRPMPLPEQRFYPQCISCSQKQSVAVKLKRSTMVLHKVLHRGGKGSGWHFVGALIGLQYFFEGSN